MYQFYTKMRFATPLLALALVLFVAACGGGESYETTSEETTTTEPVMETPSNTIVDVAVANGSFTTLVGALQQTGLDATLAGEGPFTVFAPTDAAFAKLPAGTLEGLTAEQLTGILTYHVVSGRMPASAVTGMKALPTAQGGDLTVMVTDGTVKINDATVVTADVEAGNGVIHVIDTVLMPPADTEM